jgi:hypothetical protein
MNENPATSLLAISPFQVKLRNLEIIKLPVDISGQELRDTAGHEHRSRMEDNSCQIASFSADKQ